MTARRAYVGRTVRIAILLVLVALVAPAVAAAGIRDATTIAGAGTGVLGLDGVAMAEDGTGGVVFRRTVEGTTHVFAAQFAQGEWQSPQQVDVGQRFGASFPAIGAANGGVLVVVWVQEFGIGSDRLWSAVLGRGARTFQAPTLVDNGVGEATGTFPSVSLNRGGQGYLAYSVVTSSDANASLPAGYVTIDRRLARFNGQYWSGAGASFARNTASPVRRPTNLIAPKVVTDKAGNAIIAWQEPDDGFVDRIYARRLFGGSLGVAQQVSPSTLEEKPLRGPADAFAVDTAGFGQGAITFRQQPSTGAAITRPVEMVSLIPETFVEPSNKFLTPVRIEGDVSGTLGPPSVAVTPAGVFNATFGTRESVRSVTGDSFGVEPPERLDGAQGTITAEPRLDLASSGAAAVAYGVQANRRAGVEVAERRADGVVQRRIVSSASGGQVSGLDLAGSGLGDALVAWVQGTGAGAQIAATVVDAPPDRFQVQTPIGYVRAKRIPIEWSPAVNGIGGVRYVVTVDDEVAAEGLEVTMLTLTEDDFVDGRQVVSVIAIDERGQETTSDPAELLVDNTPPEVRVDKRGPRRIDVRVRDGDSGLDVPSTSLRIGAGRLLRGEQHWSLRLSRPGTYKAIVRARDKAGNRVRFVDNVVAR